MAKCKYNGVPLPELPAESQLYDNAWIYETAGDDYALILSNSPLYGITYGGNACLAFSESAEGSVYSIHEDKWHQMSSTINTMFYDGGDYRYFYKDSYPILWTKTDICDADGNVVYEASAPVPLFDLKSWLTGFALGLAGKPLPLAPAQKEPVAYLYNGVRLPPLPEVDIKKYPYTYLSRSFIGDKLYKISFVARDNPVQVNGDNVYISAGALTSYDIDAYHGKTDFELSYLDSTHDDFVWGIYGDIVFNEIIWSNYNIYNTNGTVFLSASDPIPVYE